jgi:hypothetical protein
MRIWAVELHIDSLVVVQNITAKRSNNIVGRTLVERIRKLIDLDWEVVVRKQGIPSRSRKQSSLIKGGVESHQRIFCLASDRDLQSCSHKCYFAIIILQNQFGTESKHTLVQL